jgi:hypothetical protein
MKVISEYKLTQEQIKEYRDKGYEVYYGYENPTIKLGESVGILLDTMYSSTIDLIERLLYRKTKSKITIKYKGDSYTISSPIEWQYKYYEDHKWHRYMHPILEEYENKRAEYFENKNKSKKEEQTTIILNEFDNKVPEDLDNLLNTYAKLYDIDVDYTSLEDKLKAYMSIQYYVDNNIEYSKDILGHTANEDAMFECISVGNEQYLEDLIYKETVV